MRAEHLNLSEPVSAVKPAEMPLMKPQNAPQLTTQLKPVIKRLPLMLALGLSACSLIPEYQRPTGAVPGQLPDASTPASGSTSTGAAASSPVAATEAPAPWAGYFPDERLKGLVQKALEGNRDLRVAVLNVDQLRATYQVTAADRFPTLNGSLNGSRGPITSAPYPLVTSIQGGVTVSAYELDLFGRVRALSEAAAAQLLASESGQQAAQVSLVASVANAYYGLWADRWQLALAAETLRTRLDSLRLLQLKFDSGVLNELDLRSGQSLVESAKVTQAQAQRQWAQDLNALQLLLGQSVPPDLLPPQVDARVLLPVAQNGAQAGAQPASRAASGALPLPITAVQLWPGLPDLPVGLSSDILLQRPDIVQAENNLIAANANVGAARSARFPRISLTANLGVVSDSLSGLVNDGHTAWNVAPAISVPLLDFGRGAANVDAAIARKDIAVAQYDKAVQTAFKEVADALVARRTWVDQTQAQAAQAEAETQRLRLSTLRYDTGVSSQLDLLDAQRAWFSAQQALIAAQLSRQQAQITLYKALGGGAMNSK
jgi:multidrug efflux system outer membrane protein